MHILYLGKNTLGFQYNRYSEGYFKNGISKSYFGSLQKIICCLRDNKCKKLDTVSQQTRSWHCSHNNSSFGGIVPCTAGHLAFPLPNSSSEPWWFSDGKCPVFTHSPRFQILHGVEGGLLSPPLNKVKNCSQRGSYTYLRV